MAKRSFCRFVEEEAGKFPHFVIYAVLEWILIILLFIDGFLAFVANEFAKIFGLRTPCLFCTRIDHVLVHRDRNFYFNASLCGSHKKVVSSLAYCHKHCKVSNIRQMCETCLLSFATEKQSPDCDTYKSLVRILQKDFECFVEDDGHEIHLGSNAVGEVVEKRNDLKCSCCGEALRKKAKSSLSSYLSKGRHCGSGFAAQASSPRTSRFSMRRRGSEIKGFSENELEVFGNGVISPEKLREDVKAAMVPLLTKESDDPNNDTTKTPSFTRGNIFFGIPLTDSATSSPRLTSRLLRKSPLEKTELAPEISPDTELLQGSLQGDTDIDSILHGLKKQVCLDRKSLMELYMELDEERSASAVAANNAMAMITRLQAEKAAMQMEALQYQRMMEEQFEYDQEALQESNELLLKREEEMRGLEAELEAYRGKYGCLRNDESESVVDHQETNSNDSLRNEIGSSCMSFGEEEANYGAFGDSFKDFKGEKTYILGRKKVDKKEGLSENGVKGNVIKIDTSST